jgi:hypothetical protein
MTRRQRLLLTCLAPLALILAACGGAAAPAANDPAGTVRAALSLTASKDITGLTNLACAAQKDKILESFTGGLGGSDIDPAEILGAMNIDVSKVTVGAVTETGDSATVALGGTMSFSIDEAKMKEVLKKAAEAQGQAIDDAQLEMAMQMFKGISAQPIPMDGQTMDLVKENGAWKVCDS